MKFLRIPFAAAVCAALCACSGASRVSDAIKEGEQALKNPLGTLSQLAKAGAELERLQKELEGMTPVDPVPFNDLIAFLPKPPPGWEAGKPRGESNQLGSWKFSQARRSYTSGGKTMEVEIQDWAFQYGLYAPFFVSAALAQETGTGYKKGILVGSDPGREEFDSQAGRGEIALLVGKRFLAGIKGQGIAAGELRQWLDGMDAAGLRAKAQSGGAAQ